MRRACERCPKCHTKCITVSEDVNKTPSRCVLVEANAITKKAAINDADEKIKAWMNAMPTFRSFKETSFPIDLESYIYVNMKMKGTLNLKEEREITALEFPEDVMTTAPPTDTEDESTSGCDDY